MNYMNSVERNMYRKCVGIVLINSKNEVFLGERIDSHGSWQFPQGGVSDEEDNSSAVFRELSEETGIKDNLEIIGAVEKPIRYNIPVKSIPSSWNGEFIGQDVWFYLVKFSGDDSEINLKNSDKPEFSRYKWYPIEDLEKFLSENTIEFKKDMYCYVTNYFNEMLKIVYA